MTVAVLPNIVAVKINETHCWADRIKEQVNKIYGIYIFDKNQQTYCCELTPSYCLHYVGFHVESDLPIEKLEELEEEMYGAENEAVSYYHCRAIDKMEDEHFHNLEVDHDDYNYENDYNQMINDMICQYNENPHWC